MFLMRKKKKNADHSGDRASVWLRDVVSLLVAFLLLFSSSFQSDAASAGKLQWLAGKQVSSFQDLIDARAIADVEVRENLQDSSLHCIPADRAALKHPDPVFEKLVRLWLEQSSESKPLSVKPFGRGPPSLVNA